MIKQKALIFLSQLLAGLGLVFILSPFVLYWFIHGNHDRYIWLIKGPYPFSSFGSGPFQLFMYAAMFLLGITLTASSRVLFNKLSTSKM
jgi:hypothetical protein